MKANELRFGNYVYDTLGKVNKIDLEAITYIAKEPHNQVKPIPLTEEWLLKFGFEKQDYNMSGCDIYKLKNILIMKSFINPERKHMGITVKGISPPTWSLKDLIHVHELQNLYFALTGEELTFKSE